ncbi:MAG: DMT family transporter [Candidatus Heimdallarchaeota archaeon]
MIGEIIALGSVITFVISNVIFKRIDSEVSPSQINAVRTIIGFITFLIIALAVGQFTTIFTFPPMLWFWLILSFIIGQVIGDTAYFKAQEMLGTTIALAISMTFPIFTAIFSIIIQQTIIPYYYFIAMPLIIIGVIVLAIGKDKQNSDLITDLRQNGELNDTEIEETNSENILDQDQITESEIDETNKSRKLLIIAIFIALLASISWGSSSVLTEMAILKVDVFLGSSNYSVILGNLVRFPFAAIALSFMTIPDKKKKVKDWSKLTWLLLIVSSLIGTSLGLYLYTEALFRTNAVFVSIIGSSGPLFSIPITWLINREKINWLGFLGVILTIAGVVVIFALQLIYGNIQ